MWHLGLHLLVHQQSSMKLCNLEQLLSWSAHHLVCCSLIDGLSSMRHSEWLLDQISHMSMSASHRTPYCRTTTTLVAISAINALLQPLLDRVQTALDHPAGISDPTWQDAELADLQKLVTAAAEAQAGCALLQPIAKAVAELLAVAAASLHADQSTPTSSETDAAVSASPPCTAINCLLGMAGALVTRTVSVPTAQEAQQRWQQWRQLAASLGLQEQAHLAPVLAAPGKALLLHLQSAAQEPPKKVPLQVRLPVRSVLRCFTACTTVTLCGVQSWRLHPVLLKLDDFICTACQACGRQHTRAPAVRGRCGADHSAALVPAGAARYGVQHCLSGPQQARPAGPADWALHPLPLLPAQVQPWAPAPTASSGGWGGPWAPQRLLRGSGC